MKDYYPPGDPNLSKTLVSIYVSIDFHSREHPRINPIFSASNSRDYTAYVQ
jgi:hypothetical protein